MQLYATRGSLDTRISLADFDVNQCDVTSSKENSTKHSESMLHRFSNTHRCPVDSKVGSRVGVRRTPRYTVRGCVVVALCNGCVFVWVRVLGVCGWVYGLIGGCSG